jgi:hypothetical protein
VSAGNAAANALLAKYDRPPPAPPKLTLVATADGPACGRCRQPAARLVPAYWGRDLCPACCVAATAEFDRAGSWPAPVKPPTAPAPIDPAMAKDGEA